ncbi:MAG: glycerate kinase, partial [Eubacteriales bacterium]|nr:glycerate kinase [Eubacteriales bacterium]
MKILIASDSFKGSASSLEVADYISAGMKSLRPDLEVLRLPVADGGEGTSEVLVEALGAKR